LITHPFSVNSNNSSNWIKISLKPTPSHVGQETATVCHRNTAKQDETFIEIPLAPAHQDAKSGIEGVTTNCSSDFNFKPGSYAIESVVAEGGVGIIHRAVDLNIGRMVAMKVLRENESPSQVNVLRFIQEAKINGQLEHPNIVPVYELGQDESRQPYYTMKLVEGETLEDILAAIQRGDERALSQYPLPALLTIFEKICDAMAFAHSKRIVHRDLKPANVMVGEYGEVLVLDWGMAKILDESPRAEDISKSSPVLLSKSMKVKDSNLTMSGFVMGTPSFMAPEQLENQSIDTHTDVYALGGILYNILTLHPPHEDEDILKMLEQIKAGEIRPPTSYNPVKNNRQFRWMGWRKATTKIPKVLPHCPSGRVPQPLSSVAMKALALKPADRYPEVRSLQEDVQAYQRGFITSVEGGGFWRHAFLWMKRHRTETVITAAIALVMLILTARTDIAVAVAVTSIVLVFAVRLFLTERARSRALQVQLESEKQRLALIEKERLESKREWHLVFEDDFSNPEAMSQWEIVSIDGQWEVKGGELHSWQGKPFAARLKKPVTGDVRIEFDCRQESDLLCDMSCFVSARPWIVKEVPYSGGYFFQYGGYGNSHTLLRSPDGDIRWSRCESPLVRGKTYHIEAERAMGRLKLKVNGKVVFDIVDQVPLVEVNHGGVGLYGFHADTHYSKVRIYQLDAPRKADLLETARNFMARGNYETARDLYQEVVQSATDSSRRIRAQEGLEQANLMIRLPEELPSIRERLRKTWPRVEIDIRGVGLHVNIDNCRVKDLSPLKELPVSELICCRNSIASLEPLRGMKLVTLDCAHNQIVDLEPLRGMPLHTLVCSNNPLTGLEPLRGMSLRSLVCWNSQITSLEPLRGMALNAINFSHNQVTCLEPLRGMPLENVQFSHNQIASLEPLRGMPMQVLLCGNNRIQSLEPLRGAQLRRLCCYSNQITDVEPLAPFSMMEGWLDCSDNPIHSLRPLAHQPPSVFFFDIDSFRTAELESLIKQWSRPQCASYLSALKTLLALKENDFQYLQNLSQDFKGHHYLYIPKSVTWVEAQKLSEHLGGHLLTITNEEENCFAASLLPSSVRIWIGLRSDGRKIEWITGESVDYLADNWMREYYYLSWEGTLSHSSHWNISEEPNWRTSFIVKWDS
jgi:serine/threonine protein kinase